MQHGNLDCLTAVDTAGAPFFDRVRVFEESKIRRMGELLGVRPRGPPWLHGLRRSCGLHSPPRRFYSALALPPAVTDERTITRARGKAGPLWRAQRPDGGFSGGPSGIRTQDRRIKSQWLQPQNSPKTASKNRETAGKQLKTAGKRQVSGHLPDTKWRQWRHLKKEGEMQASGQKSTHVLI